MNISIAVQKLLFSNITMLLWQKDGLEMGARWDPDGTQTGPRRYISRRYMGYPRLDMQRLFPKICSILRPDVVSRDVTSRHVTSPPPSFGHISSKPWALKHRDLRFFQNFMTKDVTSPDVTSPDVTSPDVASPSTPNAAAPEKTRN